MVRIRRAAQRGDLRVLCLLEELLEGRREAPDDDFRVQAAADEERLVLVDPELQIHHRLRVALVFGRQQLHALIGRQVPQPDGRVDGGRGQDGCGTHHERLKPRHAAHMAVHDAHALERVGRGVQLPVADRAVRAAAEQRGIARGVRGHGQRQHVHGVRERHALAHAELERRQLRVLEVPATDHAYGHLWIEREVALEAHEQERSFQHHGHDTLALVPGRGIASAAASATGARGRAGVAFVHADRRDLGPRRAVPELDARVGRAREDLLARGPHHNVLDRAAVAARLADLLDHVREPAPVGVVALAAVQEPTADLAAGASASTATASASSARVSASASSAAPAAEVAVVVVVVAHDRPPPLETSSQCACVAATNAPKWRNSKRSLKRGRWQTGTGKFSMDTGINLTRTAPLPSPARVPISCPFWDLGTVKRHFNGHE